MSDFDLSLLGRPGWTYDPNVGDICDIEEESDLVYTPGIVGLTLSTNTRSTKISLDRRFGQQPWGTQCFPVGRATSLTAEERARFVRLVRSLRHLEPAETDDDEGSNAGDAQVEDAAGSGIADDNVWTPVLTSVMRLEGNIEHLEYRG